MISMTVTLHVSCMTSYTGVDITYQVLGVVKGHEIESGEFVPKLFLPEVQFKVLQVVLRSNGPYHSQFCCAAISH